jgi:hypothetical protein
MTQPTPPSITKQRNDTMMARALKLCERMAASAIEMKITVSLPRLVQEYDGPYGFARALREPDQVRLLLDIDDELLLHARPSLHRVVLAAVDEAATVFVEDLDRHGWREVLLVALEVDDPPENLIDLDAYRSAS